MTSTEFPFKDRELTRGVEDGVEWVTARAPLWEAANGYALLPEGHPWRVLDLQFGEGSVEIHGGITYGPTKGWVGFDTLHSGDIWPGVPQYGEPNEWDRHWTDELVADEARNLARQIAAAAAS